MAKRKKDNEELPQENITRPDDSADNFGLPEIDYKPLDRTEVVEETTKTTTTEFRAEPETVVEETVITERTNDEGSPGYTDDEMETKSSAPMIITILIILVLAVSGFLIYKYWYVPRADKAKLELARVEAEKNKKAEEARLTKEREDAERKRLEDEAAAKAKPALGTIETLTARTQRYYVVIASDIDDDLIMDYAKKLSPKGVSSKIIPPYGATKFYRLAVGDFGTYNDAQSSADASKTEYGNSIWVMRF